MHEPGQEVVTRLLRDLRAGNRDALSALLPIVYGELHQIAARHRRQWVGDESLNTTALLHEAYLRLVDQSSPQWQSQPHFLSVASTAMRQILLDYAKRKQTAKRGGAFRHVPLFEIDAALNGVETADEARSSALIALDESLVRLGKHNARQSRIVECRFFGGMSIQDTAVALDIAPATVTRGWAMAKAWLYRDMQRSLKDAG